MTHKIKLIAIFGKSGAGKDTIYQAMLKQDKGHRYHRIVSCTTRPKRDYEIHGVNYYFLSREEFARRFIANQFIEALEFNGWFYGTLRQDLDPDKINLGVFTPGGINALEETADEFNLDIIPVYIECDDKTRLIRSLNREEQPDVKEILRRYTTDEEDFSDYNLDFEYYRVWNGFDGMSVDDIAKMIHHDSKAFFD